MMRLPKPDLTGTAPRFSKALGAPGAIGALAALLSACAVSGPINIASTSGSLPTASTIQIAPFEADGSLRASFGAALADAFAAHSIDTGQSAPIIAEFAIAAHSAEAGVANPEGSTADAVNWESAPRNRGMFDRCTAMRLRATLVLLNRAEGSIAYRGVAERDLCDYGEAQLAELADALVADSAGRSALP